MAFDVGAALGEGALWDWRNGTLISVDILAGRVLVNDPGDGVTHSIDVGQPVSAAMLRGERDLLWRCATASRSSTSTPRRWGI